MSQAIMENLSTEDLGVFIEALGLSSKSELGEKICEVSLGAVNSWIREQKIPQFRLDMIAAAIAKKINQRSALTSAELRAKEILEQIYATPVSKMVDAQNFIKVGKGRVRFVTRSRAAETLMEIQGSAIEGTSLQDRASSSAIFHQSLKMPHPASLSLHSFPETLKETDQLNQLLSLIDDKRLVTELEARGWEVTLSLKKR